jgi:FtsP/CotA-like multicopper oxidase with cupredoxin domain
MMSMNPPLPWPAFPPGFPQAQSPVPLAMHLHGGETASEFDGHPDAWFTAGEAMTGPGFSTSLYNYLNTQPAATLWYHDHALGMTRLNVMSGLAGFYLLRDKNDVNANLLPKGKYEIPMAIQDRSFNLDGTLFFPSVGINPTVHPYWMPEFFGNTIMVNGVVWPFLNVDRTIYRFRLLNGSNARFYTLNFSNKMPFLQIGVDGGYLKTPVQLTQLTIAPGERADILVDFSAIAPGTQIILENTAKTPYPKGAPANPKTVGQIMAFNVPATAPIVAPAATFAQVIAGWNMPLPVLTPNKPDRILTLVEVMGPAGPLEVLLDGQKWHMPISEMPQVGSTEDWVIVNLTADTHPIHLHLVQFQLVSRQPFQATKYLNDWMRANGGMMPPFMNPTVVLPPAPYLQGKPVGPDPNEIGWKDTVRMNTGEVTRIRVRFAPLDAAGATPGVNQYAFDPTTGPGYVWHCHIIDHEDNEMMRPYKLQF